MTSNSGFRLIGLRPHGFFIFTVCGVFHVKNLVSHCLYLYIWYYVWIASNRLICFNLISCRAILKDLYLFLHIFWLKILNILNWLVNCLLTLLNWLSCGDYTYNQLLICWNYCWVCYIGHYGILVLIIIITNIVQHILLIFGYQLTIKIRFLIGVKSYLNI